MKNLNIFALLIFSTAFINTFSYWGSSSDSIQLKEVKVVETLEQFETASYNLKLLKVQQKKQTTELQKLKKKNVNLFALYFSELTALGSQCQADEGFFLLKKKQMMMNMQKNFKLNVAAFIQKKYELSNTNKKIDEINAKIIAYTLKETKGLVIAEDVSAHVDEATTDTL